jgi:hypothetical protein
LAGCNYVVVWLISTDKYSAHNKFYGTKLINTIIFDVLGKDGMLFVYFVARAVRITIYLSSLIVIGFVSFDSNLTVTGV